MDFFTDADAENEYNFFKVMDKLGYELHPNKRYYVADFTIKTSNGWVLAEYKKRNFSFNQFPDTIFPVAKLATGINIADTMSADFVYFCEFNDGLYSHNFTRHRGSPHYKVEMFKRNDRSVEEAQEPVIKIPMDLFKQIEVE